MHSIPIYVLGICLASYTLFNIFEGTKYQNKIIDEEEDLNEETLNVIIEILYLLEYV